MMRRSNKIFACFYWSIAISSLVGCQETDPLADLKLQLEEIRAQGGSQINPPPEFQFYENFIYSASLLRSPFQPDIPIDEMQMDRLRNQMTGKRVQPDLTRQTMALENFSIDTLKMVGTIKFMDGALIGLIEDPKGDVHQINVGDYMGKNHGRINFISELATDLIELIPDGQDSWVERPRSLALELPDDGSDSENKPAEAATE
ncbi:MAG: pilus assembly protein PilP [Pseudomonadota bacterium]